MISMMLLSILIMSSEIRGREQCCLIRYSSQLEYNFLHARIVANSLILHKGKLEEDFDQLGTLTVEFSIEEDFTEVFANQSIVH